MSASRPVATMTAQELMDELVDDASNWRVTPLDRFVLAIHRISKLKRAKPEQVFLEFKARTREKTGIDLLPGTTYAGSMGGRN